MSEVIYILNCLFSVQLRIHRLPNYCLFRSRKEFYEISYQQNGDLDIEFSNEYATAVKNELWSLWDAALKLDADLKNK